MFFIYESVRLLTINKVQLCVANCCSFYLYSEFNVCIKLVFMMLYGEINVLRINVT